MYMYLYVYIYVYMYIYQLGPVGYAITPSWMFALVVYFACLAVHTFTQLCFGKYLCHQCISCATYP